ncbi:MAG: LCP family protein [Clostridium fessum]
MGTSGDRDTAADAGVCVGDGREESCELTAEALSKLLFGLKIDGYFAVNMDSIPYFNDAVGGVPVTVDDEMVANQ